MGSNARDKSLRGNRKARSSSKQQQQHSASKEQKQESPADCSVSNPNPGVTPSSSTDADLDDVAAASPATAADLGYCTEEQLEELLLSKLDFLYQEALAKLSALGYDDDLALRAVLRNGHCYGSMDVLSNILHNSISYINSKMDSAETASSFTDLRQLQECALTGMVCLLQELQPHLSRGDAMWCLLMSDLHVGRASTVDIPVTPPPPSSVMMPAFADAAQNAEYGYPEPYGVYGFHGVCGPKQFNLLSPTSPFLKIDGPMSADSKLPLPVPRPEMLSSCLPLVTESHELSNHLGQEEEEGGKNLDAVALVLKSMENMTLEEKDRDGGDDPRNDMILNLIDQIRDLDGQVKERKEWAQQKAMQAARKLSNDMMELKLLRMERDENQRMKKGKQTLEDTTMKRLSEMENALRKASGQVDRANGAVRQLETENAELRAEMEASKLSNAESERMCLEIAKREKKHLKKLLAREKQKAKMEEEATDVRKKILELQQKLCDVGEQRKETEAKLKETVKMREQAILLVEEERRAKEAAEERIKRKHEALRQKNEIDLQRQKDDIQRLEDELSRLKLSSVTQPPTIPNSLPVANADGTKIPTGTNGRINHGSQRPLEPQQKKVDHGRECLICNKDEASVVFLPCAHQILCASCSESHEKSANNCPCCMVAVEQRIRVYGANS